MDYKPAVGKIIKTFQSWFMWSAQCWNIISPLCMMAEMVISWRQWFRPLSWKWRHETLMLMAREFWPLTQSQRHCIRGSGPTLSAKLKHWTFKIYIYKRHWCEVWKLQLLNQKHLADSWWWVHKVSNRLSWRSKWRSHLWVHSDGCCQTYLISPKSVGYIFQNQTK